MLSADMICVENSTMENPTPRAAPQGYGTLNPYITVKDVPALLMFLQRTFGGIVREQIQQPDGQIEHAEVQVGDSLLMIGPPHVDALARHREKSRPATYYVFVEDVDSVYARAMTCGAHAWALPAETYYGDRLAAVTDPNGNAWWIATRKQTLDPEVLQARANRRWHKETSASAEPIAAREPASGAGPPPGYHTVNPYVSVRDIEGFIDFVERTFGGVLTEQIRQPDGRIEHAEIHIGDSVLMIGPPQVDALVQAEDHERTGAFYVFVSDVDATCGKALACNAHLLEPATERFYGDRVAEVRDPYGNFWWIATRKETLGAEELQERADEHWDVRSRALSRTVTRAEVLEFMRSHRYAVQASVTERGLPQAALVGIAINDQLELFFDTFSSTRKAKNLERDQHLAFVIGGHTHGDERTVQYEGTVDSPTGTDLEGFKEAYFALHPDGLRRSKLPGIRYFRVRPRWIRYTNFNAAPAQIVVFEGSALSADASVPGAAATSHYTQLKQPWQPEIDHATELNAFANATQQEQGPRHATLEEEEQAQQRGVAG